MLGLSSALRRWLTDRPLLTRLIGNTGWLVGDRILRLGVAVVTTAWIARYLGPERLGLLSFCQALVFVFSIFATLGMESVVVRDLVKNPSRAAEILGSALLLRLAGAFIAIASCAITVIFIRRDDALAQQVTLILLLPLLPQALDVIDCSFQAAVNAKPLVITRGIA